MFLQPSTVTREDFSNLLTSLSTPDQSHLAILLEHRVNKSRIVYMLVSSMVVCVLVGVTVGIISRNVAYGAACAGVLLTLITAAQAVVAWILT